MDWLTNRLKEPSSYAALAGLGALLIPLIPPQYQWIVQAAGVLLGGAGFAVPEHKK